MKITKVLITTLVLSSLLIGGQVSAVTVKAGANCSKIGATAVASGKKFTCIKSGSKKVWNKGVKVTVKPSPKPSPTQAAPKITLDNLDPSWTLKVAYSNVLAKLDSMPESNLAPEMIYGPTVLSQEKEQEQKLLKPIMRMFAGYFTPSKYQVVMFTNKDADWAENALNQYGGNFPMKLSSYIKSNFDEKRLCTFAFATITPAQVPIYYACSDSKRLRDWSNYQTPPHEYFHLVHAYLAPVRVPIWLSEGSASFFGETLGYKDLADPVGKKNQQNFNTSHDFDPFGQGFDPERFAKWLPKATPAEVKEIFKTLETEPVRDRRYYAEYALGSIATEALVATYGVDGFMQIWKNLGAGQSFEVAFTNTFGLTPDSFYEKLTPYLNTKKP